MAAIKIGNITGVLFGTTEEINYDVIVDNLSITNNTEEATMTDEDGDIVCAVYHGASSEITLDFAIKGAGHLGLNSLVGTLISDLVDADLPSPLIVTSNSITKTKGDWQKGSLTAKYYADDFALPA